MVAAVFLTYLCFEIENRSIGSCTKARHNCTEACASRRAQKCTRAARHYVRVSLSGAYGSDKEHAYRSRNLLPTDKVAVLEVKNGPCEVLIIRHEIGD